MTESDAFFAIYVESEEFGKLYLCPVEGHYVLKDTIRGAAMWTTLERAEKMIELLDTLDAKVERIEREGLHVVKASSADEMRDAEKKVNG